MIPKAKEPIVTNMKEKLVKCLVFYYVNVLIPNLNNILTQYHKSFLTFEGGK